MVPPDSRQPDPEVPDHVLLHVIATGSYGQVWLAHNVVGTGRAVKVISRQRFQDDRPFEREFNGIQKYEPVSRSHDGLVDILQVGRNEAGGYFYYVMELADDATERSGGVGERSGGVGESWSDGKGSKDQHSNPSTSSGQATPPLPPSSSSPRTLQSDMRRAGRLPVEECVRIGIELAEAVAHLHEHGLVHRDIKPSNIIFVQNRPKLADIGLVTDADAAFSFVGTEGFIPKEGPGTAAADIYSLGKVLYEISTGLDRNQYPDLPTGIGGQTDRKELLEFNEVVLKACATDPKKRYSSAREMAGDLGLLLRGESVRRLRLLERRLVVLARASVMVLALALLVSIGFYQAHREKKAATASLSRMLVAEGARDMEEGELFDALLSFTEALELDLGMPERERAHRIRIANILRQIPKPVGIFQHAGGGVFQAGFDPHGRQLFTAGDDGKVRIWDFVTGQQIHTLTCGKRLIRADYSPDGSRLVTTTFDKQSSLWDTKLGSPVGSPFAHVTEDVRGRSYYAFLMGTNSLNLLKDNHFLPPEETSFTAAETHLLPRDGVTLVLSLTAQEVGMVIQTRVLDSNGRILAEHSYRDDPSSNAGALSYAGAEASVSLALYSVGTKDAEVVYDDLEFDHFTARVGQSDQRRVIDDFENNRLDGWLKYGLSPEAGEVVEQDQQLIIRSQGLGRPNFVEAYRSDPVFTIETNRTLEFRVRLSAVEHGDPMLICVLRARDSFDRFGKAARFRQTLDFSPDGRYLTSLGENERAVVRDLRTGEIVGAPLPRKVSDHLSYMPDNRGILFTTNSTARLWDPINNKILLSVEHRFRIDRCLFTPDGRVLATLGANELSLWDLDTGQPLPFPEEEKMDVSSVDFSPDGGRILIIRQSRFVRCLDLSTGEHLIPPLRHDYPVVGCGFSPDGRRIVTVTDDNQTHLWSAVSGKRSAPPLPHSVLAGLPRFHSSGRLLLTVIPNRGALLWDLGKIDPFILPIPPACSFNPVAFSQDGRYETSFRQRTGLHLHDRRSDRSLPFPRSGRVPGLRRVLFSSDNSALVLESREGTTRVWDIVTGDPLTVPLPTLYTVGTLVLPKVAFPTEQRPAQELSLLARFLSGSHLDDSGELVVAEQSGVSWAQLKERFPDQLDLSDGSRWHEMNALQCEQDWDWWGALFHWDQLIRLEPTNKGAQMRRDYAKAALEDLAFQTASWAAKSTVRPPRPPGFTEAMIDLSPYYTQTIKEPLDSKDPENTLASLPCLVQDLGAVSFDVRGIVRLGGARTNVTLLLNRAFSHLHFLHATENRADFRTEAARYVIHYADGQTAEIPVNYCADVVSLESHQIEPLEPIKSSWFASKMQTVLAWAGTNPSVRSRNHLLRLFRSTWRNPDPGQVVSSIEVRCQSPTGLLLIAVTTE